MVLVDYNDSKVFELSTVQRARLPPNPMKHFWNEWPSDLVGWAPTVLSDQRRFQEWLCHEFSGEKKALYEPVLAGLEFHEP